jgi:hypothetical protein
MQGFVSSPAGWANAAYALSELHACPTPMRNLCIRPNLHPSSLAGGKLWYHSPLLNSNRRMRTSKSISPTMCTESKRDSSSEQLPDDFFDLYSDLSRNKWDSSAVQASFLPRRGVLISSFATLLVFGFASLPHPPAYSQSQAATSTVIGHGAGAQTKAGKNRAWAELSKQEQDAARFLGFDGDSWDTDNKVYIDRLLWEQLSPAQRKAAKTLAFNKKTWNDEGETFLPYDLNLNHFDPERIIDTNRWFSA